MFGNPTDCVTLAAMDVRQRSDQPPVPTEPGRDAGRGTGHLLGRYGPWAVVTGASSGLGRESARRLAGLGFGVVLVARREDALRDLARQLASDGASGVRVVPADLSTADGVAHVLAETHALDVGLVVLAAGYGTTGPFRDADIAAELDLLAVNCAATTALSAAFGRRLLARGSGGLVLFGSLVGGQGTPWSAHYAASKAYVQTLGEGLAAEWHPHGVDVLVALPGPVTTGFAERAGMTMSRADTPAPVVDDVLRALGRRTTVVPGRNGRVLTRALATLPRRYRTRVLGRVMQGMVPATAAGR